MLRRIRDVLIRDLRKYDDPWYYAYVGIIFVAASVVLLVGGLVIGGVVVLAFAALFFQRALRTVRHRRRMQR